MEMEHINENTIRVNIENTDLEERGITFLDLLGNQRQIENFFYSILEEVDIHEEFQETDSVTFQVVPKKNGLELYISKGNSAKDIPKDLLQDWQEGLKDKASNLQEKPEGVELVDELTQYKENNENGQEKAVFMFESFEDLILLSRTLFLECGMSTLYSYKETYYMEIVFFVDEMRIRTPEQEKAIALEFGQRGRVTEDVLAEYGKALMEMNICHCLRVRLY